MPSYRDETEFAQLFINRDALGTAIEWIKENLSPEDVFTADQLNDWAHQNDFKHADE